MYFIHKIRRDYSAYVQKMILNEPVFPNFSPPDGHGAQRAKIAEKVHKPPLGVNFELNGFNVGFPAGPFRPGKSREGPGTERDRTGPRDLEGPVVLWSRD